MDLVVMSLEPWDDVWRRNQHLIACLLADDPDLRVLFVEPAADPLHDIVSGRSPGRGTALRRAEGYEGLLRFRPVKWFPRRIDAHADERLARSVLKRVGRAGMTHPILWINDPAAAPLARLTGWPTLYDITDDWLAADRPEPELARLRADESWLLEHAAAVVACSPELVRRKIVERPGGIELITNGVDVDAYRVPRGRPADLPKSSALYVGTLHRDRLDIDLCMSTAQTLGVAGRLVLVGPNSLEPAETARLTDAGVLLLGPRRRDEVIAYLQHADVLTVPHVVTSFTESLDPIKLYEYLAVHRPVVSTPVAGFRDTDDAHIRIAVTADFPRAVLESIQVPSVVPEGADMPIPDWNERAAQMRAVIDGMV
jgi:teichuronic acid biosynthesis glycosyltransferase TuaH